MTPQTNTHITMTCDIEQGYIWSVKKLMTASVYLQRISVHTHQKFSSNHTSIIWQRY